MSKEIGDDIAAVIGGIILLLVGVGILSIVWILIEPTPFEQHIQDRIKAADSMAITAQEKAVSARSNVNDKCQKVHDSLTFVVLFCDKY